MKVRVWVLLTLFAVCAPLLSADEITPNNVTAPFAIQPFAGLLVASAMTGQFFSALASPPFITPGIVDILANIEAFDASGDEISTFQVTGVTVMQGTNTVTPLLQSFVTSSSITYTDTVNPFNSATVDPANLNLAFEFNSDSSFQYSYYLDVTGIPDGGFVLYDDIEGAIATVPEPASWLLTTVGLVLLMVSVRKRQKSRPVTEQH